MVGQQTNGLGELCQIAAAAVQERGHVLEDWVAPPGVKGSARTAVCRHCGRTVSVRAEPGLTGVAGPALTEPCRVGSEPTTG